MPVVLFLIFFLPQAFGTALVNRSQYLNTEVLPDGLWTFGLSHGETSGNNSSSFGSGGGKVSNQDYFSRDVSYNTLLDEIDDPLERELADAAFDVYGVNKNQNAGNVINDVSVSQKSDAYIFGRGFGKKLSLFAIFPVVTLDMRFTSKFELSDSLKELADKLIQDGQYQKAQEILEKSQNALAQRLQETSYRGDYPGRITTLANVYLTTRYKALQTGKFNLSSDTSLVVPAGRKSDTRDFLYLRINEEQYSVRQSLTGSFEPSRRNALLSSVYYHKRFPFEKARRIPMNGVSPISQDIDPNTNMQYGDSWGTSAQANHLFSDSFLIYAGQSFEIKNRDRISGGVFSGDRYRYLEKNSSQSLSISYLGFAYNSISSFLAKKFIIPMDVNVQYSLTQSGKNTFNNQALTMNLMVFYK